MLEAVVPAGAFTLLLESFTMIRLVVSGSLKAKGASKYLPKCRTLYIQNATKIGSASRQ